MDTESNNQSKKNTSKTILVIILSILLMCVIVGMILLIAKPWEKHDTVTYQENPKLFCEQNPEHALCNDVEISFWDDPVNYCLKNPDVQECEKQGETDFCEKNPSSVLCDKDPNNDYNWIDDYANAAFKSRTNEDNVAEIRDFVSNSIKGLVECVNNAGFHVDSYESLQQIADQDILAEKYNSAQLQKVFTCSNQFMGEFTGNQTDKQ